MKENCHFASPTKVETSSNPSHSNLTKAINARIKLERKNNGGNQQMIPRSRF
jgi:hypothetical protein